MKKALLLTLVIVFFGTYLNAQRYLSDLDSSLLIRDTLRPLAKRFENLRITGYMQPQFQVAQADGAPSYAGGNFSQFSRSRFMLRRARIKIEYLMMSKQHFPQALFAFQIDATERGVIVRDMFIRMYETRYNWLSMTAGFFARPFGFEVNLGSSHRESPERGRMSQILMPGERDLGVMFSFEQQRRNRPVSWLRLDAGFFNGQGASGTTDFDSHKDFIARLYNKPFKFKKMELTGGLSFLRGGWKNGTKFIYSSGSDMNGNKIFTVDSSVSNLGKSSPRHYQGADLQWKLKHAWGETELRAEYWFGTQPGTATSTANPGTIPTVNGAAVPTYIRHFDGAFFYFLQNIMNTKHQLIFKYDWYDPNIKVNGTDIGKPGTNLSAADISFNTIGFGYAFHFNPQTKIIFYYDRVKNERAILPGFGSDLRDDVFTCRLQFKF
jgi:hypothetical protein